VVLALLRFLLPLYALLGFVHVRDASQFAV
jgi:hypothetical protein